MMIAQILSTGEEIRRGLADAGSVIGFDLLVAIVGGAVIIAVAITCRK